MEAIQSFRWIGSTDITDVKNVLCENVDGQNIIYWEDIKRVFPKVEHVQNGNIIVSLLRDSNRVR